MKILQNTLPSRNVPAAAALFNRGLMTDQLLAAFQSLPTTDPMRRSVEQAEGDYRRGKVRQLQPSDRLWMPHADAGHDDYGAAEAHHELLERLRARRTAAQVVRKPYVPLSPARTFFLQPLTNELSEPKQTLS
jgi:hypothetical protein